MWKIFLSSTAKDLAPYREAVYRALHALRDYHCVRMEDFKARDAQALDLCLKEVGGCHLFVTIVGLLHGSCPPGSDLSYTEHEYQKAADAGLSRLVFLTPDDFPLRGDLREPEQSWLRQQAFRKRVSEDRVRALFSSPEELALEVVTAVRNWERGRDAPPGPPRMESPPEAGAGVGPLVFKMCDRRPQEEAFLADFATAVREHPGCPQIYVVCGEERECPESLVDRLTQTHLQQYADSLAGENQGALLPKQVEWPVAWELGESYRRLLAYLFREFDPLYEINHEELSPSGFASFAPLAGHSVVVLKHEVRPERGEDAVRDLLQKYLTFWDGVAAQQPKALLVVFLWILYPARKPAGLRRWWPGRRGFDREAFKDALAKIREARKGRAGLSPLLPLEELSCVKEGDVMNWFSRHRIYDVKTRQDKCGEMFSTGACLPMAEIEPQLKSIQDSLLLRGGR